jgi:hypothetical protein
LSYKPSLSSSKESSQKRKESREEGGEGAERCTASSKNSGGFDWFPLDSYVAEQSRDHFDLDCLGTVDCALGVCVQPRIRGLEESRKGTAQVLFVNKLPILTGFCQGSTHTHISTHFNTFQHISTHFNTFQLPQSAN